MFQEKQTCIIRSPLFPILKIAFLVVVCLVAAIKLAFAQPQPPTDAEKPEAVDPASVLAPTPSEGPLVIEPPELVDPADTFLDPDSQPPPLGPLVARLRLLTYNVYGLDKDDCETRAETFGNKLAFAGTGPGIPFDIVGVQEYYEDHFFDFGKICDHDKLRDAAQSTGRYLNSNNTRLFRPVLKWKHNGGVGVFTLHPIIQTEDWQWNNDTQSWPKAAEGFLFARIDIPFTELTIDLYVVHLNSGKENNAVRRAQLEQLAAKISQLSSNSGNPVIVMGDFNIGGPFPFENPPGNAGYGDIIAILGSPRDLWLHGNWLANPNLGYTTGCGLFSSNPNGCLGKERIDYIFHVTDPELTNSPYQLVIGDVFRVRWAEPVQVSPVPVHYVADHFGVDATIEIRQKP